jgi:hypothetical protein
LKRCRYYAQLKTRVCEMVASRADKSWGLEATESSFSSQPSHANQFIAENNTLEDD